MNPRIFFLALGTFAIGTEGYVIAGVLPHIADNLGVSLGSAGLLVTAFALVYALGSPVLSSLSARWPRRKVLLAALAIFTLANGLAALAPTFGLLIGARIVAALGAALYTPLASAAAVALARPERRGQALSIITGGLTVAIVLGVPIGTFVGQAFGWRMTFVLVAALSSIALLGAAMMLPEIPAGPTLTLRARLAPLTRPAVLFALALSTLWITGAFTVYTYLAPLLEQIGHMGEAGIRVMLLVFGLSSMVGAFLGGFSADHWGVRLSIAASLVGVALSLFLLPVLAATAVGAGLLMVLWGIAGWSVTAPQQHRLITLAPENPAVVLALNGSAMYFGQALGAVLGGLIVNAASVWWLGPVGGALELVALTALLVAARRPATVAPAMQEQAV